MRQESAMFNNLYNNQNFRGAFKQRILEFADTIFEPSVVDEKITEYEILMEEPMEKNHQRFFGTDNSSFYYRTNTMREFAKQRKDLVEKKVELAMQELQKTVFDF